MIRLTACETCNQTLVLELLLDVWTCAGGGQNVCELVRIPPSKLEKTWVCLVVISKQGYGKGTIAELVGKHIYGESDRDDGLAPYVQIGDIDSIAGRFNASVGSSTRTGVDHMVAPSSKATTSRTR